MKKDARATETGRPFRLAHQTLCITGFNFETESLIGYVEMLIHPLKPDLKRVKINSKQCRVYRVAINEVWDSSFLYNDPTMEICQGESKQRNLDYFESCHQSAMTAIDADYGNGELTVKIPPEAHTVVSEMKPFRICIEFSLERPKGGVKFVVPDMDGTMLDRGAHLFTYGLENSSRLWFPCVDSYSEVCTWKLEFTVDMYMTAVSCGDLIETVYTSDLRKKTYHYYLSTPTAAPNIALAVGPFEVLVDPNMHEVTHFCLPHLMPILQHSTAFLHEAFEFYEELLSIRYPYSCYKQVFVDQAFQDSMSYATLTIFSTNLLHTKRIIDQTPLSRQVMAHAIAEQFFGSFISMASWADAWLSKGISGYLSTQYKRRASGNNEYRKYVAEEMKAVLEYEQTVGGVTLDPTSNRANTNYFPVKHPHTASPRYHSIYEKKAHLVIRILEIRIGNELLLQVLNKLLALATASAQQKINSNTWNNLLLSTSSFVKFISSVTGKDVEPFIEQWIQQSGHAQFIGSFVFNRKRNVVELELKQDVNAKGALRYAGPLTVAIQELDGTFNPVFKSEENKTKFEITCHSKSRRQKKKKIPLCTGEEVDMDLGDTDADSPVLWLRVDPEMTLLRQVKLEQPDWMWQYMLRYERCVVAQTEAIAALEQFASPKTRLALTDTLENDKCFYRVRIEAAKALAKVANTMASSWAGPPAMMTIFKKMFSSHSCPAIVRQNNFSNFQHYFLQKAIPVAMANLRTMQSICPAEVLQFIFDLFKYNDNSKNKFSDNFYRAALIDALAATVTPAVTTVTITGFGPSTDSLTADTKNILEEISRCLNLEKLLPCYKHTVTVSCLKAIRKLQQFGHLPSDSSIFKSYAIPGNFVDVRLAALEALVDYSKVQADAMTLLWLLDMVEEDPEPFVRHKIMRFLIKNPPFTKKDSQSCPVSTDSLVERLWRMMNSSFSYDSRLRCDVVDFYYTLYGRTRPSCLPIPESVMVLNLKERRTMLNPSVRSDSYADEGDSRSSLGGLKRSADFSLSPPSPDVRPSGVDSSLRAEPSEDSQFKVKIRLEKSPDRASGADGFEHLPFKSSGTDLDLHSTYLSPPMKSPTPPRRQSLSFTDEFLKFSGVLKDSKLEQDSPPLSQPPPPLPSSNLPGSTTSSLAGPLPAPQVRPQMSVTSETVSETTKLEDAPPANLSEDSESNSLPAVYVKPGVSSSALPTSFDSSMFSGGGGGGGGVSTDSPAPPTPSGEEGSSHKSHKSKKKKKKNKKHKKHKHERHERSDKTRERSLEFGVGGGGMTGLMDFASSGQSATNSPVVHKPPSSPEFEVM